jgi:8-oxo-dGTP pyrophosphatase MutT (NUDIX family)
MTDTLSFSDSEAYFLQLKTALNHHPAASSSTRPRKKMTIIHVADMKTRSLLLGHKARGFGAGKWNGFGGKFDPQVDLDECECARRELQEECGLATRREHLQPVGIIFFHYPHDPSMAILEVHVFVVDVAMCSGTVQESEEMTPIRWFPFTELPLRAMWVDDELWLAKLADACTVEPPPRNDGNDRLPLGASSMMICAYRFAALYVFSGFELIVDSAMLEWKV